MGDPGLLEGLPDVAALLPQAGGNRKQAAAAEPPLVDWTP
jgi:hypothetical protein